MGQGYEIPINPDALDKLIEKFDQAGNAADRLDAKVKNLNGDLKSSDTTIGGRPASSTRMRDTMGTRGGRSNRTYDVADGPNQRVSRARRRLEQAMETGDQDLIDDARIGLDSAQRSKKRAYDRLNNRQKTQQELIYEALMTSRIGPGGQLYPLVGRLHKAGLMDQGQVAGKLGELGMNDSQIAKAAPIVARLATAALPVALAAGVVAVGAGAAIALAQSASASIRRRSDAFWQTGGTSAQVGQVLALGGPNAAAKAVQFGDSLRQGSYGAAYMRSRGIVDLGPHTVNKADNYLRAIRELRTIESDEQAIRVARDIGMTDELRYRDLDSRTMRRLEDSAGGLSPEERKAEARFQAEKDIFGNYWDRGVRAVGTPTIRGINTFLGGSWDERARMTMRGMGVWGSVGANAWEMLNQTMDERRTSSPKDSATKEHAEAMRAHTRMMKDQAEAIGFGPRANSAMPSRAIEIMRAGDDKFYGQSWELGAFSIS